MKFCRFTIFKTKSMSFKNVTHEGEMDKHEREMSSHVSSKSEKKKKKTKQHTT